MEYDFCVRRRIMMIIKTNYFVNVLLFELVKMLFFIKIMYRITVTKRGHDVCKLPPM